MFVDHEKHSYQEQSNVYQIRINGSLDSQWSDWFEGFAVTPDDDGNTLLTGSVVDQAGLHGLIKKIRDLGLTLISVVQVQNCSKKEKK